MISSISNISSKPVGFASRNEVEGRRRYLNRGDIDDKAEQVILHFDSQAFSGTVSPLYKVVAGLHEAYRVPFQFDNDLGYSASGKKVLGRFEFGTRRICIDGILPYDSPRFRWTLSHELGHFVLHRKLDPSVISQTRPVLVDTATNLRFAGKCRWSDLDWVEWQANQFASALLLPRAIVSSAVDAVQRELGIRRRGVVYLDSQPCNYRDYVSIMQRLATLLNVSRTVLRIRLINLKILVDARSNKGVG